MDGAGGSGGGGVAASEVMSGPCTLPGHRFTPNFTFMQPYPHNKVLFFFSWL